MRSVLVVVSALVPLAAVAGPNLPPPPPSDFGLTFSTASTTTVSTIDNPGANTTTAGDIVSKRVGSSTHAGAIAASTYTVTSDDGFFFKQDIVIEGQGSASSTTTLNLTFTNTQSTGQDIRFDSYVIPGHYGFRQVAGDTLSGSLDFHVTMGGSTLFSGQYSSTGDPSSSTYRTTNGVTGGSTFNGASEFNTNIYYVGGHDIYGDARDWWDHRFYLDLGYFAPGESRVVTYSSTVSASIINNGDTCTDLGNIKKTVNYDSSCSGIDISFGDPRTGKGVVGANVVTQQGQPGSPIVGYANDPFFVPLRAYQTNRPEIPQDVPPFTPNYDGGPDGGGGGGVIPPSAVPEPAALGLLAFGLVVLVRRRRL